MALVVKATKEIKGKSNKIWINVVFVKMREHPGLDSLKNYPNHFPEWLGVGVEWFCDVKQDFCVP